MGTTLIGEPGGAPKRAGTTLVEPVRGGTRIVGPGDVGGQRAAPEGGQGPVTGWLVVVAGPGTGRSVELGYGMNMIGRASGNRVVLDFGDDQISQDDHFRIAYDGANRKFHLIPGRGTNLVYVAGSPLLTPVELAGPGDLKVGATTLRFVPLCTSDWSWPAESGA
jgi:FHA domain